MKTTGCRFLSAMFSAATLVALSAQIPNTLIHSIPAPPVGVQSSAVLGQSVAIDGPYAVIGAPGDDIGGPDSGVIKVFDSVTGALVFMVPNPSPAVSRGFGQSVSISGMHVVVGAPWDSSGAASGGCAYVFDLSGATPALPIATLSNPTPAAGDDFGLSVSISGMRVVVGAPGDSTGASSAGSAYVYDLSGSTPTVPVASLNNPSPASSDAFGYSIAVSGTRVVVGARLDDTGASNAGNAYVYDLSGATPALPIAMLANPAPAVGDEFGFAVSISGARILIGARLDDTGAANSGSAYIYDLTGATPTLPIATLNNPSPSSNANFGRSLAMAGMRLVVGSTSRIYVYDLGSGSPTVPVATLNLSGYAVSMAGTKIVVGDPSDDTAAVDAGRAYIYELSSGTPTLPVATLNSQSPSTGDYFGHAVAVSGPLMVVGAIRGEPDTGSAYVYDLSSATPSVPMLTLDNPSPATNDQFGCSVAISGAIVVVGAFQDDTGAIDAGSAYVYDLSGGTPTIPVATLNNPSPADYERFGLSTAISGTWVVVGASYDGSVASGAGSVYVYNMNGPTPTLPVMTLNKPSPAINDFFGHAVAISGTRVVVAAPDDDTGGQGAGSAHVYDLSSGTPLVPVATLNNPSPGPAEYDYFGSSVAISGTRVLIGAINDDTGGTDAGSAYVYDLGGGTPTIPVATLNNPSAAVDDQFGYSVALSGTRVVIGAYHDDAGASDSGSAYLYDVGGPTPSVPVATLQKPIRVAEDFLGSSVAIDGTTVAIGTPYDDAALPDKGAVYVFGPAPPPEPEVAVTVQPSNANIADGGGHDIGPVVINNASSTTFTIRNTGPNDLILSGTPKVTVSGTDAGMFGVTTQPISPIIGPSGSSTFTVQFLPTSGGVKTAALSIPNNDDDEAPFDIILTGTALTFTNDSDSDGMNDASEFQFAALGFDWQVNQTSQVNTYYAYSNGAGLYTSSQVQALNVGIPLIQRNATTGIFKLTIGVEKSTDLTTFSPFPMAAPQTLINPQGKLEFEFTVPDNAAFFRVLSK